MKFWQNLLANFFILMSWPFFLFSCSSSLPDANATFEKRYRKEVDKITSARSPGDSPDKKVVFTSAPPTGAEMAEYMAGDQGYYPYVDVTKFGEKIPYNPNLPNGEVYEQTKAANPSNALPPNIFEITYNTKLNPPFQRIGAEFDTIQVPEEDAYGVKTEMSHKTYLLAGGKAMQRSVDLINTQRSEEDAEISRILISEKKQLERKRKMEKIFGNKDSVELALLSKDKKDEETKSEKKDEEPAKSKKTKSAPEAEKSGFSIRTVKN